MYEDVFILFPRIESKRVRESEEDSERMLAQNQRGELRQKVASGVILALTLQTWTHWANFFSESLCLKAKGHIKVQVICTCM